MQENAVSRKSRSKFFPKVICLLSAWSLRGHICETIWNLTLKFWRHIFEYISNRMRWLAKNWFFLPSKPGSPLKRRRLINKHLYNTGKATYIFLKIEIPLTPNIPKKKINNLIHFFITNLRKILFFSLPDWVCPLNMERYLYIIASTLIKILLILIDFKIQVVN